jgi:hypothetical protein
VPYYFARWAAMLALGGKNNIDKLLDQNENKDHL